jgi:hypothetical protein
MNSRRFTGSASRASDRKDSTPQYGRRLLRCGVRPMSQMGQGDLKLRKKPRSGHGRGLGLEDSQTLPQQRVTSVRRGRKRGPQSRALARRKRHSCSAARAASRVSVIRRWRFGNSSIATSVPEPPPIEPPPIVGGSTVRVGSTVVVGSARVVGAAGVAIGTSVHPPVNAAVAPVCDGLRLIDAQLNTAWRYLR